jgi:hypothetical protein
MEICPQHEGFCSCATNREEKVRFLIKRREAKIRARTLYSAQEEYAAAYAGFRLAREAFWKAKEKYLRSHKSAASKAGLRKKILKLIDELREAKKMLECEGRYLIGIMKA